MSGMQQYQFLKRRVCARPGCGNEFGIKSGRNIYCDAECSTAESNRRQREKYLKDRGRLKSRRKLLKVAVVYGAELDLAEAEVIRWIGMGKSDEMIAEIMDISTVCVSRWAGCAKIKLGAESRAHAVALLLKADHAAEMTALREQFQGVLA